MDAIPNTSSPVLKILSLSSLEGKENAHNNQSVLHWLHPLPRRNDLPVCLSLEVSFSWNISGRDVFPLTLQDSSTTGNLLLGEQPVRFIYLSYHGCDEGSLH